MSHQHFNRDVKLENFTMAKEQREVRKMRLSKVWTVETMVSVADA